MKKSLLILTGFLVAQTGFSQMTQANEPAIGASESFFLCDSMTPNLESITGSSAVWDYTNLALYQGQTRTVSMLDATATTNASSFPSSVKAYTIEGLISVYYNSTATERTSQGFVYAQGGVGDIIAALTTDQAILMTYPFGLSASNVDTYSGTVETPQGAFPATGSITSSIDGSGTINFPLGVSVSNVIRLKSEDDAVAVVPIFGNVLITRKQFEYYDYATSNLPIMIHISIDLTIPGAPAITNNMILSKFGSTNNVGVEDNDKLQFAMYPNPSNDVVTFKGDLNNANVTVLNAVGQEVLTQTISNGESMNVSNLNSGIYLVKVESNGVSSVKRLSIN